MPTVFITLGDVGAALQLEERLSGAGVSATWGSSHAGQLPTLSSPIADVVMLGATDAGESLPTLAQAWRDLPHAPGVIAIGNSASRDLAAAARCTLLSHDATPTTLLSAIAESVRLRFASGLNWQLARRALALAPATGDLDEAATIIAAARTMELETPRAALGAHATHYVTDLGGIAALRSARALTIPEVDFARYLGGEWTLQRVLGAGPIDSGAAVRLLWALASTGAIALTPEPLDLNTPARRAVATARLHVRGRLARLEQSTFFDVLEVSPAADDDAVELAVDQLATRFSPHVLDPLDLADLSAHVPANWELVEKARAVLLDIAARGRYLDWLRSRLGTLRTVWAIDAGPIRLADAAFARGQRALANGDPHQAMSDFAAACRAHPGHPEYEASLSWARYRVEVAAGRDRAATAHTERTRVDTMLAGTRPWPRALLAQALLCVADGDADSARYHLLEALRTDPNLPAAKQLLSRLGEQR